MPQTEQNHRDDRKPRPVCTNLMKSNQIFITTFTLLRAPQTAMTPHGLLQAEEPVTMVTKAWTKDMLHESIYTALFHQTTHCFQFPNKNSSEVPESECGRSINGQPHCHSSLPTRL